MSDDRHADGLAAGPLGGPARERTLVAPPPASVFGVVRASNPRNLAFTVGFIAVILTFALPSNLLVNLGLYSETPGGNPLTKFHPATYTAILAAWLALYGGRHSGGMTGLFRDRPALAWSIVLILVSIVCSAINFGVSGTAFYVETYLAAALLLIALETGTERQLRILGYTILVFALVNVAISLIEGRAETHLIPPTRGLDDKDIEEFRGAGLYAHPLTAALVTSMVLLLALGMRLRPWVSAAVFGILFIGLLSFGGRSALATTVLLIAAAALFQLSAGLVTRRLSVGFLTAFIAGSLLLPLLFVVLTTTTDVGQRIMTHLYLDDSAEVRVIQWRILDHLNLHDVLFGISLDRLAFLKVQIGLSKAGADIENFWLLMFLNLGVVGFPFLAGALFLLLLHQAQLTNTPIGYMIVIATLLICSTSNSIGHKGPDLLFLAGCMVALRGFRSAQESPVAQPEPVQVDPGRRTALMASPLESRVRALSDRPMARPAGAILPNPGRP
jgi:hypothetical protein